MVQRCAKRKAPNRGGSKIYMPIVAEILQDLTSFCRAMAYPYQPCRLIPNAAIDHDLAMVPGCPNVGKVLFPTLVEMTLNCWVYGNYKISIIR